LLSQPEILSQINQHKKFAVEYDGTWYNKFNYKLEFDFSMFDIDGRKSWPLNNFYQKMIEEFKANCWEFRKRRECYIVTVFTSDTDLIEHVLNDPQFLQHLLTLHYTSDRYSSNKSKLEQHGIVTDVKFRREVNEYRYQIFFGDLDYKDRTIYEQLCQWIADAFKDNNIIASAWNERLIKDYIMHNTNFMYNGFNCYMKSEDDIMILHFIAPGHIKKVFCILEKEKK